MTHFPQVHPQRRSPRIQLGGSVLAAVILEDGQRAKAKLQTVSVTGGLLRLARSLTQGDFVEVAFQTQSGPVRGMAEMLTPVSWNQQAFRFVTPAHEDQCKPQVSSGRSPKLNIPVPQAGTQILDPEPQWIDKYRAAVSRNPPRRPLLARMLEALRLGSK